MKREKLYSDNFKRKSVYEDVVSWCKKYISKDLIGWLLIFAMFTVFYLMLSDVKDFFG